VIVAALRSDVLLFLELLVFLLPLFLACRMLFRGKNADVRVYSGLGSLVLIVLLRSRAISFSPGCRSGASCSAIGSATF